MTDHRPSWRRSAGVVRRAVRPMRHRIRRRSAGANDLERRLTWISGSPRTGSTWLLNLLAVLTDAVIIDEPLIGTHLATPVSAVSGHPEPDGELLSETFKHRSDYFFSDQHESTWGPGLRRLVLDRMSPSVGDRRGVPVIVKEPNGARGMPMLLRCLPSSRLLFLVRDGRDVVDSFLDGADGGWISQNLGVSIDDFGGRRKLLGIRAAQWVRDVDAVQRAHDSHDPNRRVLVRYEDLRGAPVAELVRITAWLGHPTPESRVAEAVSLLDVDNVPEEQRGRGRFVRSAHVGGWRESFDQEEQSLLQDVMGPTLARLGYLR